MTDPIKEAKKAMIPLSHYCVGCGICKAKNAAKIEETPKGFYKVDIGDPDWLKDVCPAGGVQTDSFDGTLWGKSVNKCYAWSNDDAIRKMASSGGVLTEIACTLLDQGIVDGVIQISVDPEDQTKTVPCISYSREEVIKNCGSRYTISHPLELIDTLKRDKLYLFIGKPCDVDALKNASRIHRELQDMIPYTMSFFCAGLPSADAQKRLLSNLGCEKANCVSLRYRGNGWPGYATAKDKYGHTYKMDYATSWGQILGRDVMPMCRVCLNGIGETADIACGDGWYLRQDGEPDFSEREGRNILLIRTDKGRELVEIARQKGKLHVEHMTIPEADLCAMQPYQTLRRQTMLAKILALKLLRRPVPAYPTSLLRKYAKTAPLRDRLGVFKGTLERILKGKM